MIQLSDRDSIVDFISRKMELPVDVIREIMLFCPVDALFFLHRFTSKSMTLLLDEMVRDLSITNGVDSSTFDVFIHEYNKKWLFVHNHPEWYVDKFIYTIPIEDVLRMLARQQQFELLDRVLTEQILWTSTRHIKKVCKELYCLGQPLNKYLALVDDNYPNSTPSDIIMDSCRREMIKRGSLPTDNRLSPFSIAYNCSRYGQLHLVDTSIISGTVETILSHCKRLDLLERRGNLVVIKDPPEGLDPKYVGVHVSLIDMNNVYFDGSIENFHHLERLGLEIDITDFIDIWEDIRNLECYKLIGTKSGLYEHKYVCEARTKEDLRLVSMECCSASVVFRNVEYLTKTIGIDDEFLRCTFRRLLNSQNNYYDPYELRMMAERYPQVLTEDTRKQLKGIICEDKPMRKWLKHL